MSADEDEEDDLRGRGLKMIFGDEEGAVTLGRRRGDSKLRSHYSSSHGS